MESASLVQMYNTKGTTSNFEDLQDSRIPGAKKMVFFIFNSEFFINFCALYILADFYFLRTSRPKGSLPVSKIFLWNLQFVFVPFSSGDFGAILLSFANSDIAQCLPPFASVVLLTFIPIKYSDSIGNPKYLQNRRT